MRLLLITAALIGPLSVCAVAQTQSAPTAAAQDQTTIEVQAQRGDTAAQFKLAQTYFRDDDEANGMKWLRKSAEAGNADAQNLLGFHYKVGSGGPPDLEQARLWYRKAADQGLAVAANNLCISYTDPMALANGVDAGGAFPLAPATGTKRDVAEAFAWCGKAANAGMPDGTYRFGLLNAKGGGDTKPDYEQAYFWLLVRGTGRAYRDVVGNQLTPEKRAQIEQRARAWKPTTAPSRVP